MTYVPRRQSKRWLDGDCPKGVLAIYDDPREPGERYTVFYAEVLMDGCTKWIHGRGMSEHPTHPQGVGMSFGLESYQVAAYRYRNARFAAKWSTLPKEVQDCVRRDLEVEL